MIGEEQVTDFIKEDYQMSIKHVYTSLYSFIAFAFLVSLMAWPQVTKAQEAEYVQASLVTQNNAFVVGQKDGNILGLFQDIADHWHVYWRNAGDSGLETRITWNDLPDGVTISDMTWPVPQVMPYEGLINYGYEGSALYPMTVALDDNFVGDEVTLNADVTWLVCMEICIPESAKISITVPVVQDVSLVNPSVNAPLFNDVNKPYPVTIEGNTRATIAKIDVVNNLVINADIDGISDFNQIKTAHFFPYEWGMLIYSAPQKYGVQDGQFILEVASPSDLFPAPEAPLSGVLRLDLTDGSVRAYELNAAKALGASDFLRLNAGDVQNNNIEITAPVIQEIIQETGATVTPNLPLPYLTILFFALLGGIILNLMPCVFPVLSMKAMDLVRKTDDVDATEKTFRMGGLIYTLGVVVSFGALGGLLLVLRAAGQELGWGFQLQSPIFVAAMVTLFMLVGFNLLGVFEISTKLMSAGGDLATKKGHAGSFWTGVLAVVVASPCTAPFMASALGATLILHPAQSLLVFVVLGIGLALPYLLVSFVPFLRRALPKPGAWMDGFKQFMAFPMFASALWLFWVLSQQASAMVLVATMAITIAALFLLWSSNRRGRIGAWIGMIVGGLLIAYLTVNVLVKAPSAHDISESSATEITQKVPVQKFSADKLALLRAQNKAVFVNMTAAWCITCLANEGSSLSRDVVQQAMVDNDITYMKGDWTNFDAEITTYLKSYGRSGVPLYVYYDADGSEKILPQILTPDLVLSVIQGNI